MKPVSCLNLILLLSAFTGCALMEHQPDSSTVAALKEVEQNPVLSESGEEAITKMASTPSLVFRQSWEALNEPGYQPASVRFGVHQGSLVGVAVLHDSSIGNRATHFNARTWELGDVFEIFITDPSGQPYYEFHVTPENMIMQMRWPAPGTLQREAKADTLDHSRYFLPVQIIESRSWIDHAAGRWIVAFALPLQSIRADGTGLPEALQLSFCRYDVQKDDDSTIYSSTTELPFAGFHEVEFWPRYRIPTKK